MTLPANDQDAATASKIVNHAWRHAPHLGLEDFLRADIAKALREARAEERESCAEVAATYYPPGFAQSLIGSGLDIAAAIRARGGAK